MIFKLKINYLRIKIYFKEKIILARKVSEIEKNKILGDFKNGLSIKELSLKYKFSIQTISKHLKNNLDESLFSKIKNQDKNRGRKDYKVNRHNIKNTPEIDKDIHPFFEIIPLSENIEFEKQKEISSIPLIDINFPKVVFMIIDKKIELEIKLLKDFTEWQFLPEEDLQRKTIRIFSDQKKARKICSSTQKLIKVPNPNVFSLVSDRLISKGITRIIFDDLLVAL